MLHNRASKAPGARALAAETLALLTLVAADDLELTQTIMLTLEGMQTSGAFRWCLRVHVPAMGDSERRAVRHPAGVMALSSYTSRARVAAELLCARCLLKRSQGGPLRAGSSKVQTAALRGWTLLLSALPAWQLTAPEVERHLANLAQQLQVLHFEVATSLLHASFQESFCARASVIATGGMAVTMFYDDRVSPRLTQAVCGTSGASLRASGTAG